jgi:hypothetical protein
MPFGPGQCERSYPGFRTKFHKQVAGPTCLLLKTILPVIGRSGALPFSILR